MKNYAIMPLVDYAAACDSIRAKTGKTEAIKSSKLSAQIDAVHEAGKEAGIADFMDKYQDNGNRTSYRNAFAGIGWDNDTFKPNHDIVVVDGYMMFYQNGLTGDFEEILKELGITFSLAENFSNSQYMFAGTGITRFGELDFKNTWATNIYGLFASCPNLETIDKLILPKAEVQSSTPFDSSFSYCNKLKNIFVEGVIGANFDIKWSPLTVASMKSIIGCLKNFAGTDKEYTQKLSFSDTCWAALEADSTSPTGTTWKEYVGSLGWNT